MGVRRIEVSGIVQGAGFRPFVYRPATEFGLRGDVRDAGGIVVITARPALVAFGCQVVDECGEVGPIIAYQVRVLPSRISTGRPAG